MRITTMRVLGLILTFTFSVHDPAYGSSNYKCKTPARDINAIAHRKLFNRGVGNWYSTEKQKELDKNCSAELEQRVQIVQDIDINAYVDHVAQRLALNSDADVSITVRIIRTNDADAVTLIGGHLYLTIGLLLKLRSEGELASVLTRASLIRQHTP